MLSHQITWTHWKQHSASGDTRLVTDWLLRSTHSAGASSWVCAVQIQEASFSASLWQPPVFNWPPQIQPSRRSQVRGDRERSGHGLTTAVILSPLIVTRPDWLLHTRLSLFLSVTFHFSPAVLKPFRPHSLPTSPPRHLQKLKRSSSLLADETPVLKNKTHTASAPSSGRHYICPKHTPACRTVHTTTTKEYNKETLYKQIVYLKWKYYLSVLLPVPRRSHASASRFMPSVQAVGDKLIHTIDISLALSYSCTLLFCFSTYRNLFLFLSSDLWPHDTGFYIIPNDQWNACVVSWINRPLKHV